MSRPRRLTRLDTPPWKITENKDTMQWFIQPDVIIQRAHCDETTKIFIIINKAQRFETLDARVPTAPKP